MNRRDLLRRMFAPLAGVAVFGIHAPKPKTITLRHGSSPVCAECYYSIPVQIPKHEDVTSCPNSNCKMFGVKIKVPKMEAELA